MNSWCRSKFAKPGILTVFDQVAESIESKGRVFGCPLNNLSVELAATSVADFRTALHAVFEHWHSAIEEKLRTDQADRYLERVDPGSLATLVIGAYSGAMTMAKASQSSAPLSACAQQMKQLLQSHTTYDRRPSSPATSTERPP